MDHHSDLLLANGWNWMISCWSWRGVTGGCAPKPEGESIHSIQSLTPSVHRSPFFLRCDQETSHISSRIYRSDMKSHVSISLVTWDGSIYACESSKLRAWFIRNAVICAMWTQDIYIWATLTSGNCVFLPFLVIIWHVCFCGASLMSAVLRANI